MFLSIYFCKTDIENIDIAQCDSQVHYIGIVIWSIGRLCRYTSKVNS